MTASDICSALHELPVASGHTCSSKTFTLQVGSTSALQHTCVTFRQVSPPQFSSCAMYDSRRSFYYSKTSATICLNNGYNTHHFSKPKLTNES